jgi:hypothetical protein
MADAPDLGSGAARRESSSLSSCTRAEAISGMENHVVVGTPRHWTAVLGATRGGRRCVFAVTAVLTRP